MFTGITIADIEALAKRTAVSDGQDRRPGIVVLAIGENKARIVYEVVRRGLVTELIIDHDLAFELGRLCKIDMVTELPKAGS
jgi:hypothetical protein